MINGEIPRTKIRTAQTTVVVKDGQRIIIGGLINTEERETTNAVPILSKIPIIGKFFTHKDSEVRETNLVIEITPHILHDGRLKVGAAQPALEKGTFFQEIKDELEGKEQAEEEK